MANKKKLSLDKKTVSKLTAEELRNIDGGVHTSCTPTGCGCPTVNDDEPIKFTANIIKF